MENISSVEDEVSTALEAQGTEIVAGVTSQVTVLNSKEASQTEAVESTSTAETGQASTAPGPAQPDATSDSDGQDAAANDSSADRGSVENGQSLMSTAGQDTDLCPRETSFTSEVFKIEISNLPKKVGFKQLHQRLSGHLGLKPHKIKALNKYRVFICFRCEEDRQQALEAINGHVWKGNTLKAKKAAAAVDPMKRKRHGTDHGDGDAEEAKRQKLQALPLEQRVKFAVTPLWEMAYEEQLKIKAEEARQTLKWLANERDLKQQFQAARLENDGMCCRLSNIVPSPVLDNYRNKCEFSIGHGETGSSMVVGFRVGLYKDGSVCVADPSHVSILSPDAKAVAQSFEHYLQGSQYAAFDHETHKGHWRQLTVKTSRENGGIMAIAEFVTHDLTQEEVEAVIDSIRQYFSEGEGQAAQITSFFFRPCTSRTSNSTSEEPYHLIYGNKFIVESLLGMKFRISPSAFFQVNTAAAEVLYSLIGEWCSVSPTTVLLDICCGTGTIGLSLAKKVSQVIGVEMCQEAIDDAKENAKLNGVENCQYHCARVEDVIRDITSRLRAGTEVVAILDPPRAGLHKSVLKSLRMCGPVKRIVYASCKAGGVKSNFLDLVRPATNRMKGAPFSIIRAVPVDMFPQTRHCELLTLFERPT